MSFDLIIFLSNRLWLELIGISSFIISLYGVGVIFSLTRETELSPEPNRHLSVSFTSEVSSELKMLKSVRGRKKEI